MATAGRAGANRHGWYCYLETQTHKLADGDSKDKISLDIGNGPGKKLVQIDLGLPDVPTPPVAPLPPLPPELRAEIGSQVQRELPASSSAARRWWRWYCCSSHLGESRPENPRHAQRAGRPAGESFPAAHGSQAGRHAGADRTALSFQHARQRRSSDRNRPASSRSRKSSISRPRINTPASSPRLLKR